jgi:hypothetical protein
VEVRELLLAQAQQAWKEIQESIDGVSEQLAWARVTLKPDQYLHTEGSILSIVAHVAACKFVYGSMGFRDLEIRWRDTVDRMSSYWPSWEGAKHELEQSHLYLLECWQSETDFDRLVPRFDGQLWPASKIVWTTIEHDCYHAGQIQILRSTLSPDDSPPPNEAELWKKYCEPLPSW